MSQVAAETADQALARAREAAARWRLPALALALVVLVLDQWSKFAAIDALASPVHPMVVTAEGSSSVADLLATRGLSATEVGEALSERLVWRYVRATGLTAETPLAGIDAPRQLMTRSPTGFPSPRRLRVDAADARRTVGDVVAERWRLDPRDVADVLRDDLWRADAVISSATDVPAAGTAVVLLRREVTLVSGFMKFVYAENPGAAWGFLRDMSATFRVTFFSLIGILAMVGMTWAIWTGWMATPLSSLALAGVLGGAVGNFVDRNLHTIVVDFVLNFIGEHRWPVYNVADIGISVGVALILLELLLQRPPPAASPTT